MRFHKLDLNQLVVLDALFTEQSVKKAAEKVFLSPAATSCALARLREFFEDDLLVQVGKKMFLTDKARCLQAPVKEALLQIQVITNINPEFDPQQIKRKLIIQASDYVITVLLMDFLKSIREKAPLMRIDLRLIGTDFQKELTNGDIDILIAPSIFVVDGHPKEFLFEDTWSCITWDQNSFANQKLKLDQYKKLKHVVPEWGAGRLMSFDEIAAQKNGLVRERAVTVPNYTMIPSFLEGNERISTIQTKLAQTLAKDNPLAIMECPLKVPIFSEYIQYNKVKENDPVIAWFKNEVVEYCRTFHS